MKTTDKHSETIIRMFGGVSFGGITLTQEQLRALKKFYGIQEEDPEAEDYELLTAGNNANCFKLAQADGLRVIAFLIQYCGPKEDPVQMVAHTLADSGYDVDFDFSESPRDSREEDPEPTE